MTVDREYCMSSFLTYRTIQDPEYAFADWLPARRFSLPPLDKRLPVRDSETLENELRRATQEACKDGKAALALSGGIDSAALARFMPKGSTAYTFRCVVPGMQVTDESPGAARYAEACGLKHKIIDIYWEDFEALTPKLMKRKGMPVHSIEIQIYKAALQAKRDGFERLIFGETADVIYGGLDGLLSKDWLAGDFIERFAFVPAWKVLRDARLVVKPMLAYERDGHIDPHEFISQFFIREVVTSYFNACGCADIEATLPYLGTYLDAPLDYARVRGGENKYLVREMFRRPLPRLRGPEKAAHAPRHQRVVQGLERPHAARVFAPLHGQHDRRSEMAGLLSGNVPEPTGHEFCRQCRLTAPSARPAVPASSAFGSKQTHTRPTSRGRVCCVSFRLGR